MPARRSVGLRNGTPRDAVVNTSLSLVPKGVRRAREELGLVGETVSANSSPSSVSSSVFFGTSNASWFFAPVVRLNEPNLQDMSKFSPSSGATALSSSSHVSSAPELVAQSQPEVLVETAKRHRPKGPIVPDPQRPYKGSVTQALQIARNAAEADRALEVFCDALYAPQTLSSKASLRNTWSSISRELGFEPLPLTPSKLHRVSAVLRASNFRSAYSYACEMKQWHVRSGFEWNVELDLALKDAKRAVTRGLGPPSKAEEIPMDVLTKMWRRGGLADCRPDWPALRHEVWVLAVSFLLREVELAGLRMGQSETFLDMNKRCVTLFLPVSKSDPMGRGCKRALACTCGAIREPLCPFCATVELVKNQVARTGVESSDSKAGEIPLVASESSPWDTVRKEAVVEAVRNDLVNLFEVCPEFAGKVEPMKVSGHSFRRSGAKTLARKGVPIDLIQYMARHSSNAIVGYVEEAIEEAPNGAFRLQEHLELRELVNLALRECAGVKESLEAVTLKLQQSASGTPIQIDKELILQTFNEWTRPEVVLNVVSGKLHSTFGNAYRRNPKDWVTTCGWRWVTAGQEARACLESSDLSIDFTICAKCRDKIPSWVLKKD